VVHADGWLLLGDGLGSRWCDGFLGRKSRAEVSVQSGLVGWIRLDQGIDQCMLCLQSQHASSSICIGTWLRCRSDSEILFSLCHTHAAAARAGCSRVSDSHTGRETYPLHSGCVTEVQNAVRLRLLRDKFE
jgi:hypothetical protein